MTPFAPLWRGAGLALGLACASAACAQPYYNDSPASYPWRNGVIEGPAGAGPGGYAPQGGYDPNAYQNGYPVPGDPNAQPYDPAGYAPNGGYPPPGYGGPGAVPPGYGAPGYGGPGYGGAGYPAGGFPAPDAKGGTITVTQGPDGRILVTRYAPVWTSEVGPNGWAHRHYYHYGWPTSGLRPIN